MAQRPLAVGLVGAGHIARMFHLPVLAGLPDVRLVAVATPRREPSGAGSPGGAVPWFGDLQGMLAAVDLDAVVICASTPAHAHLARDAFAAGKSVYLEKPIAVTVSDGRAVVDAQRTAGTTGMTGFNLRFAPALLLARERIAAGAIGEVVAAHSAFTSPPGRRSPARRGRVKGGGALLDSFSHQVDLVRWLLGTEIGSVSAQLRSVLSEDDTAAVTMRTTTGVLVSALASTSAADDHRFEIVGTEGRLIVDPWRMSSPVQLGIQGAAGLGPRLSPLAPRRLLHRPAYRATFAAALSTFASSALAGGHPAPDLLDGLHSLAVVAAAERAAQTSTVEPVAPVSTGYA